MPKVNLTKRVLTAKGMRYCEVATYPNGHIKPHCVLVDGKEERHTEGAYYIDYRQNGKRVRQCVGNDVLHAKSVRQVTETKLAALDAGLILPGQIPVKESMLLVDAAALYLEEIKLTKKPGTHRQYENALLYFKESCGSKKHLHEIDRKDLLRFSAFLRDEKDLSPRTVWNKFNHVLVFLKAQGIRGLVSKNDWPQFTQEEPEVYEKEELDKFFVACTESELVLFEFFLMTGFREQEVMYTYWSDVNLSAATVKITHKPDYGWTPKKYKEREVPIPTKLVESLRQHRAKANGSPLLFPTPNNKPDRNFRRKLSMVVERAELNPEHFWLHKFRSTFATWHLWAGVDLRTVQLWLGHSDLASTMRYLKPSRSKTVRDKVNATFA
jgi:integrase/recombinase XerD